MNCEALDPECIIEGLMTEIKDLRQMLLVVASMEAKAISRAEAAEAQIAMDSENIRRMQEAGHAAEYREAVLREALEYVARVRESFPKGHSRHLILKLAEGRARATLTALRNRSEKLRKVVEAADQFEKLHEVLEQYTSHGAKASTVIIVRQIVEAVRAYKEIK